MQNNRDFNNLSEKLVKLLQARVDNFEQARNSAMKGIVNRINDDVADPAKAKKVVSNFLNNLKNVGEQSGYSTSTKHSRAMFVDSALDGTREKVVPVDLQRDIDKLIRSNSSRRG